MVQLTRGSMLMFQVLQWRAARERDFEPSVRTGGETRSRGIPSELNTAEYIVNAKLTIEG